MRIFKSAPKAFLILILGVALQNVALNHNELQAQTISDMVVGNNVWYINPSDQVWNLTAESGVGALRIGGAAYDENLPSNTQLLNWVNRIQGMGSEPIIQVSQYGTPEEAAALVRFFNKESNGNEAPVKYWNIGNEPWLQAGRPNTSTVAALVEEYFKPIATAMKEADSTIKIYGPDFAYFIEPALNDLFGGAHDISGKIPGKDYYYTDGISWHRYPQNENLNLAYGGLEDFRSSIIKSKELVDKANALQNRTGEDALEWGIGEFNAKGGSLVHTWENGHMFAGVYNLCMKYSATYCTTWSMFENGGSRQGTDFSFIDGQNMTPRPTYRHMEMIAMNFKGEYLDGSSSLSDIIVFGSEYSDSVSVMILNRADAPVSYSLVMDGSSGDPDGVTLTVDADTNLVYSDIIPGLATHTLVFGNDEIVKTSYDNNDFINERPPSKSTVITASVAPSTAANFKADSISYDEITLSWDEVEGDTLSGYLVERKLSTESEFELVGLVDKNTTTFTDPNLPFETSYTYRLQAYNNAGKSDFTAELEVTTSPAPVQVAYNGPHSIPGRIEVEFYDDNDEGISYHDFEPENRGGAFRTEQGVDIESTTDTGGGYNIGYVEDGEWLEYTVENITTGRYDISLRVASQISTTGRRINIVLGEEDLGDVFPAVTGGWQNWTTLTINDVEISADSEQVLRLNLGGDQYNINWIEFNEYTGTSSESENDMPNDFELNQNYPNPFNPTTSIDYSIPIQTKVTLEVFNVLGTKVATLVSDEVQSAGTHSARFNAASLSSGIYFYTMKANGQTFTKRMMLIK